MKFFNKGNGNTGNATTSDAGFSSGLNLDKVDLGVQSGAIDLDKGQVVTLDLDKTDDSGFAQFSLIGVFGKDYDVLALVEYKDGHTEDVACFGTTANRQFSMRTRDGAVVHFTGDKDGYSAPGGQSMEIIHVTMNPDIKAIAFYVYSAKNSGSGSFKKHRVSSYVVEGHVTAPPTSGTYVSIAAKDANSDNGVYSVVPAIIHNTDTGMPAVEFVEAYSRSGSELRPVLRNGVIIMDGGSENLFKKAPGQH